MTNTLAVIIATLAVTAAVTAIWTWVTFGALQAERDSWRDRYHQTLGDLGVIDYQLYQALQGKAHK